MVNRNKKSGSRKVKGNSVTKDIQSDSESQNVQAQKPHCIGPVTVDLNSPVEVRIQTEPDKKDKPPWNWWLKFFVEVGGLAAVVWYACITHSQWLDLRHNFEVDQRSWVKIETGFPELGPFGYIDMTLHNVGKSPALHPILHSSVEIVNNGAGPSFDFDKFHTGTDTALLFPGDRGAPAPTAIRSPESHLPITLSPPQIQSLIEGKTYLAAYGIAIYSDQFGKHWTKLCTWRAYAVSSGSFNADSCVAYNAVGDGNPPK